jgi:hypothetical protein
MVQLQKLVLSTKKDIHIDLSHRHAKLTMQSREKDLKLAQVNRGVTIEVDYFIYILIFKYYIL